VFIEVNDTELLAAIQEMGTASGVFAEPTKGTAWAGLTKANAQGS
jgi:threonine synthase